MASTSETGHAKNVANFQDLIAFATGYGATYSPSKTALKLPALNALYTLSNTKLANVLAMNTAYNNVVNVRAVDFNTIKPLGTRVMNALEATDATKEKLADAKKFNRKLQGRRAGTSNGTAAATPLDPNAPAPKTISVSQQSYDQMIQHLAGLISVAASEVSYAPNESDLKIAALTARVNALTTKNNDVATSYATVSNSRIDRNKTLYSTDTGLIDIANDVKKYIKSVFGASSPEYKQVHGIAFREVKI